MSMIYLKVNVNKDTLKVNVNKDTVVLVQLMCFGSGKAGKTLWA